MIGGSSNPVYPAFKALIDVLCYPIVLLDARGPTGGVIAILAGIGLLGWGYWIATTTSLWGLGVSGVGVAYCVYGLSRLYGQDARLRRAFDHDTPAPESMSREQIAAVVQSRPVPFFVCTRCHVVMAPGECGGRCTECGSEIDCLPVYDDADRSTVRAALY